MLALLNKIDAHLASFRLAMVSGNDALIQPAADGLKAEISAIAAHADARKYKSAECFAKEFPKALEDFLAAAKAKDEKRAMKALDTMTAIVHPLRTEAEGQPADRNHI